MDHNEKYYLQPGFIFVSMEPYLIHTVLGSCVSVCLWDSFHRFGGMNHYIYSRSNGYDKNGKYGNISIPYLIKLMIEMGAEKGFLKAHIIGGGQNPELSPLIGAQNAEIAEEILQKNHIEIVTKDVGGCIGRKVVFNNENGEILVYKGTKIRRSDWV